MTDPKLRVLITAEEIQARIRELGAQISNDYPTGNLHMICILKGATFFMADLARAMTRDVFIDFMGISSYGKGKSTSGEVRVTKDLDISVEGANVLIVEDIVDSGVTLNYLMHLLDQRKPHSASPRCSISPSAACAPCIAPMSVSKSPTNSWSDMVSITRSSTEIWTPSACWKRPALLPSRPSNSRETRQTESHAIIEEDTRSNWRRT
jgi:hypoxanthine phosphoribosyltransferase